MDTSKFETIKMTIQKSSVNKNLTSINPILFDKVAQSIAKAQEEFMIRKMREELLEELDGIYESGEHCSVELLTDDKNFVIPQQDISSLKKRIKHCKNHMERQRLQRELNALYKEQKRRK